MTSDSEFVAFINHAIQLALNSTIYPNIWAVLFILLETQDVNSTHIQVKTPVTTVTTPEWRNT